MDDPDRLDPVGSVTARTLTLTAPDVSGQPAVVGVTDNQRGSATAEVVVQTAGSPLTVSLSANPSPVEPGGTVVLMPAVAGGGGFTYSWTVPIGWTPVGPTVTPTLTLIAPSLLNQAGVATLSVGDATATMIAIAVVQTSAGPATTELSSNGGFVTGYYSLALPGPAPTHQFTGGSATATWELAQISLASSAQ